MGLFTSLKQFIENGLVLKTVFFLPDRDQEDSHLAQLTMPEGARPLRDERRQRATEHQRKSFLFGSFDALEHLGQFKHTYRGSVFHDLEFRMNTFAKHRLAEFLQHEIHLLGCLLVGKTSSWL